MQRATLLPDPFKAVLVHSERFASCLRESHPAAALRTGRLSALADDALVAQGMGVSVVPALLERSGLQGAVFRPLAGAAVLAHEADIQRAAQGPGGR